MLILLHKLFSELERVEEESVSVTSKIEQVRAKIQGFKEKFHELERKKQEKEKERRELELQIRNFELSIKEEEEKIKRWEAQLRESARFREQMTLVSEISEAKKEKSRLEDEVLKLIIRKDDVDKEIKQIESDISDMKDEVELKLVEWEEEINKLEKRKSELNSSREELLGKLKEFYSDIYQSYVELSQNRRVGRPIARVENSACMSCHMVVLPDIEARLYSDPNSYEVCTNCGAILYVYFDEEEEGEEQEEGREEEIGGGELSDLSDEVEGSAHKGEKVALEGKSLEGSSLEGRGLEDIMVKDRGGGRYEQ